MKYMTHGRTALLWLSVAALPFGAMAQYEMGLANSNYSGIRGVLLNPAAGAGGKFKWDLNGLSAGVRFDNTFLYVLAQPAVHWTHAGQPGIDEHS